MNLRSEVLGENNRIIESHLHGKYHDAYKKLGFTKDKNNNFHCPNTSLHKSNDKKGSWSINNETGVFKCHGCDMTGNLSEACKLKNINYYDFLKKEYGIKLYNNKSYDKAFSKSKDFCAPDIETAITLNNESAVVEKELLTEYSQKFTDIPNNKKDEFGISFEKNNNPPYNPKMRKFAFYPTYVDLLVKNLLDNKIFTDFLMEHRNIDVDTIKSCKIGLYYIPKKNKEIGKYTFCQTYSDGYVENILKYDPFCKDTRYKFSFFTTKSKYKTNGKDFDVENLSTNKKLPSGMGNITSNTIVFFEGEPDYYCAMSYVKSSRYNVINEENDSDDIKQLKEFCRILRGSITLGSANSNIENYFNEKSLLHFKGKRIIICFDADNPGRRGAKKLANTLLNYEPFEIKIIELDKISGKSLPLNIELKDSDGNQIEKDFTDYMKKNKFEMSALKDLFLYAESILPYKKNTEDDDYSIEYSHNESDNLDTNEEDDNSEKYSKNTDENKMEANKKTEKDIFKVSIKQAASKDYFSDNGEKIVSFDAKVSSREEMPSVFCDLITFDCFFIKNTKIGEQYITTEKINMFNTHDENNPSKDKKSLYVKKCCSCNVLKILKEKSVKEYDDISFQFIPSSTTELNDIDNMLKKYIDCSRILDSISMKYDDFADFARTFFDVRCKCDVTKRGTIGILFATINESSNVYALQEDLSTISSKNNYYAYIIYNDLKKIDIGKQYKFIGVNTCNHKNKPCFFIDSYSELQCDVDSFIADEIVVGKLNKFKQMKGESIKDCFTRRYICFCESVKIKQRELLFEIVDAVFFSSTMLNRLSIEGEDPKTWIDVLILGEPRASKSSTGKAMLRRYSTGEFISCSRRGTTMTGLLCGIESLPTGEFVIKWGALPANNHSIVMMDELQSLDPGVLSEINAARTDGVYVFKKIASGTANMRTRKLMTANPIDGPVDYGAEAINQFLKICDDKPEILTRFDAIFYLKVKDVNFNLDRDFDPNAFPEEDSAIHNLWFRSIKSENYIFEDDIRITLREQARVITSKYHNLTNVVVDADFIQKLIRIAITVAARLFSIKDDDPTKLYIKKEHVVYAAEFIDRLYSHPNMQLDKFSEKIRLEQTLRDMSFYDEIFRLELINPDTFCTSDKIFKDNIVDAIGLYMTGVERGDYCLFNGTTGVKAYLSARIIITDLEKRNCLKRVGNSYASSNAFRDYLNNIKIRANNGEVFLEEYKVVNSYT